jgi:agmatine/peptidylarginine deiminase
VGHNVAGRIISTVADDGGHIHIQGDGTAIYIGRCLL